MKKYFLKRKHESTKDFISLQRPSSPITIGVCASVAIFLLFAPQFLSSQEVSQSLNSNWQFSESGKNEWLNATVPGTIHTDLLANKKIPDPYIGTNESKVQWVETKTWEYKTSFDADANLLKCKHKELVFDGLDTYAFVYLNDSLILTGENMFLSYRVDVSKFLKKQNNVLRIVFHPASELIAKNKALSTFKNLPGGDRVFIRKAQYQFGWDFGPRLVTCGIWKNVKLEGWNNLKISTWLRTDTIRTDTAILTLQYISDLSLEKKENEIHVTISEGNKIYGNFTEHGHTFNAFNGLQFKIPHPRLWWCNGMGKQNIYHLTFTLTCGKIKVVKKIDCAIRIIRLGGYEEGEFTFLLNNQPAFIKGANWIPADNFTPRVSSEKYYSLIKSAQQSNMNMLRVWGGGIYEDDNFYNDCDSLGILVWQDYMFAGGIYPANPAFKELIKKEITSQFMRIAQHPCIAVWCGNNEIQEGWNNWGWQKEYGINAKDSATIWNDENQLFSEYNGLMLINGELDPFTMYISTSPSIGWSHPEAYKSGDVHYWGVWWNNEPFSSYDNHVGRFMSEYGLQSLPQLSSFKLFDNDPTISLSDSTILTHQKSENGFAKINSYIQNDYPVQTDFSDFKNESDFSDYIYVSQVMQRDGISRAINDHRRAEPYCMGTMFWQFNDCWPGITWSSTDYYGQPKLVQYALKDLYAPMIVSVAERNDSVLIYVVNDDTIRHKGILGFQWMSFDGVNARTSIAQTTVYAGRSMMILGFEKKMLFDELKPEKGVMNIVFSYEDDKSITTKYYFVNTKSLALDKDPGIITDIVPLVNSTGGYTITLRTVTLAKNVYLSIDDATTKFSANGFDLMAGETKDVVIKSNLSLEDLKKRLKIQTMNNFRE